MKLLSTLVLMLSLTTGFLCADQEAQRCPCKRCRCTPENNCGCLEGKPCKCSPESNCETAEKLSP